MTATKAALTYAYVLLCVIAALTASAFAQDADAKKQLDQFVSLYVESFNKQDAAGLAALYAEGGILVNPTGPQPNLVKYYETAFKAGINRVEVSVDQAWSLGSETLLGIGKYRVTGKDQSGAPIESPGLWTATYVREGGKLKIRMLNAFPQPPPAK